MRIWKFSGDVKPLKHNKTFNRFAMNCFLLKVVMIWYNRVSKFDHDTACLFESLLEEDGLEGGVKLLPYVLQQARFSKANCILQTTQEVLISEFHHIQCIIFLLCIPMKQM